MSVERSLSADVLLTPADSMARARPLRAWRTDALGTMRRSLEDFGVAWCRDWGVACRERPLVEIAAGYGDTEEVAVSLHWRAIPGTSLWWSFRDDVRSRIEATTPAGTALRAALFGRADGVRAPLLPEPAPIERDVVDAAWNDWWRRLAEHLGEENAGRVDEATGSRTGGAPELPPWSGNVSIRIDWCGGTLLLRLDARHAARLAGGASPECGTALPAGARRRAAAPVEEAMASTHCPIRADLGEVELSLGQLQELALGDVIPLAHRLDHPATLRGPDGDPLCAGWLGQRDGNVAVELSRLQRVADVPAGQAGR